MNKLKRVLLILLAFVMVFTTMPIQTNAATTVKLNKSKLTLYVGESYTLKLKNNKKKVTWSSSDKTVATVSSKGKVKAKKAGICKITAKAGEKNYKCNVTVKSSLSVNKTNINIDNTVSEKVKVTLKYGETVSWSIANANIVSCQWSEEWEGNTTYLIISGRKAGKTVVTLINEATKEKIQIYVEVTHKSVPVTSIKLSETSLSMSVGDIHMLKAIISPINADNDRITWYSSDTSVATVDNNGVVRAVAQGKATITASIEGLSIDCDVIVKENVTIQLKNTLPETYSYYGIDGRTVYAKTTVQAYNYTGSKRLDGTYRIDIDLLATKTYEKDTGSRWGCFVDYRLYDLNGMVVDSGIFIMNTVDVGDTFHMKKTIFSLPAGEYVLVLSDHR